VSKIAQTNYSVLGKLLDAADSLAKVQAGILGDRCRNWRDAIEAAGNALQLTTELQFAVSGNPKKPSSPSLASQLGVAINPFPDWETNWKADRDSVSRYRNYLVHDGLVYTVRNTATGETLVLGRAAFAGGTTWKLAEASYATNPQDWERLEKVCEDVWEDTVAFIDLSYERIIIELNSQLTNPVYQLLWGWPSVDAPTVTTDTLLRAPIGPPALCSMQACSSSKTVFDPRTTVISSGPCLP
jgi:hypothetical protein